MNRALAVSSCWECIIKTERVICIVRKWERSCNIHFIDLPDTLIDPIPSKLLGPPSDNARMAFFERKCVIKALIMTNQNKTCIKCILKYHDYIKWKKKKKLSVSTWFLYENVTNHSLNLKIFFQEGDTEPWRKAAECWQLSKAIYLNKPVHFSAWVHAEVRVQA